MLHLRKSLFSKKNQYFRTIGPSMAPLELLSKRQAVVFKAPCACIGFPAIYIGLEPILEKKKIHVQFYGKASREGSLGRLLEKAPWEGSSRRLLEKAPWGIRILDNGVLKSSLSD